MKNSKKIILSIICSFCMIGVIPLNGMKRPLSKETNKTPSPVIASRTDVLRIQDPVWVKCSDDVLITLPKWKIDQIQALKLLYDDQAGANSAGNAIDINDKLATKCDSKGLQLISNALDAVSQGLFADFLIHLDKPSRDLLINSSGDLEAQGLFALCASDTFPLNVQNKLVQDLYPIIKQCFFDDISSHFSSKKSKNIPPFPMTTSLDGTKIAYIEYNNIIVKNALSGEKICTCVNKLVLHAIVFSADGNMIISDGHNQLMFWNANTGALLNININKTFFRISSLIISKDGKKLAVADFNGIYIVDLTTREAQTITSFGSHHYNVQFFDFSYDGTLILYKTELPRIIHEDFIPTADTFLHDIVKNQKVIISQECSHAALNPDNTTIAFSERGNNWINLWNIDTGEKMYNLDIPSFDAIVPSEGRSGGPVAFTDNGTLLACAKKNYIAIWNMETEKVVYEEHYKDFIPQSIKFNREGTKLFTEKINTTSKIDTKEVIEYDFTAENLFDLQNLTVAQIKLLYQFALSSINNISPQLHPDSVEFSVYQSLDAYIKNRLPEPVIVSSTHTEQSKVKQLIDVFGISADRKPCIGHESPVYTLACGKNNILISGGTGYHNKLFVWDTVTQKMLQNITTPQSTINTIAISPDGRHFVVGGQGGLTLCSLGTDIQIPLQGHAGAITMAVFNADGSAIVSASDADWDNLFVWNGYTGKLLHKLIGHHHGVNAVSFKGKMIVSGGDGNSDNLLLWDSQSGALVKNLQGHTDDVISVAWSPHVPVIISGGAGPDNNLFLWNLHTGNQKVLQGHSASVRKVMYNQYGDRIISAGDGNDNNLFVWDSKGVLLYNLKEHTSSVSSIDIGHAPGSNLLVSSSDKKDSLLIWDIALGKKLSAIESGQSITHSVIFNENDTKLIAGGGDNDSSNSVIVLNLNFDVENTLKKLHKDQINFLYTLYIKFRSNIPIAIIEPSEQRLFKSLPPIIRNAACQRFGIQNAGCHTEEATQQHKKTRM